jgi:hypothetical protein
MTNHDTTTDSEIEARFLTPGKGWKAKTFKTEAAFDRYVATLDDDVEVRVAR